MFLLSNGGFHNVRSIVTGPGKGSSGVFVILPFCHGWKDVL